MSLFRLKKIIAAVGLYDVAALAYLKWLARRRGLRLEAGETDHGPTLRFHGAQNRCIVLSRRHVMYGEDMIRFFDYYFGAVVPHTENGESIVDYSQPAWQTLRPSGVKLHFSSLPESDTTTELYLEKAALGPNDVIIDLGGYCGGSSYFFARAAGPGGRVLCLEPDPLNFESLQKNIAFHQLKNVTALPLAAWSHSGKLRFETEGNMGSGVNAVHTRNARAIEIDSITLDDLVAKYLLERIDLIKMDIEGAECVVLRSAASLLAKFRPRLVIEPHVVSGKLNTDEVFSILSGLGYKCEIIQQGELKLPLVFASFAT